MSSDTIPVHHAGVRPLTSSLTSHLAVAAIGVLVFLLVMTASGTITAGAGQGWDGQSYAGMMAEGLDRGSVVPRSRPFLPLVTRIPYALGLDVNSSFRLMNVVYAFALYFVVALLLDRYGATSLRVKALVVVNLALCIATSKMWGYYPVQIDLGALALIVAACYFIVTDRHWLAGLICIMATASREFGIAAVLFGLHRTFRRGRLWPDGLCYVPSIGMAIFVRWAAGGEGGISIGMALSNLTLWASPIFVAVFLYFAVTIFGGISAILAVHPRWCAERLRAEPELATFLAVIVGLSAMGNFDIWRYLVFMLPVAIVLIAQYFRDWVTSPAIERPVVAALTFVTVITQRPFERMDINRYFQDWFPLYDLMRVPEPGLLVYWAMRLLALLLLFVTLVSIRRSGPPLEAPKA
jgi:hypothetical protein